MDDRSNRFPLQVLLLVLAIFAAVAPASNAAPAGESIKYDAPGSGSWIFDGVTAGPDGALWLTHRAWKSIGRFAVDGTYSQFPLAGSGAPAEITSGPDGNLWFTEANPDAIGRITPQGQYTRFPTTGSSDPFSIVAGPDGNLWFSHGANVGRISPAGQIDEFPLPSQVAYGLAVGGDGNIWVKGSNKIARISPVGVVDEYAKPADVSQFNGITRGGDGNVWLTAWNVSGSPSKGRLIKVEPDGTMTVVTLPSEFDSLERATTAPDGSLWISLNYTPVEKIGRYTMAGETEVFDVGAGVDLRAITTGPDGNIWGGLQSVGAPSDGIARIATGVADPAVSARPSINGAHKVGQVETCNLQQGDSWFGVGPSFASASWLRDGATIAGATGTTYTPTEQDLGHQLSCSVLGSYEFPKVTFHTASLATAIQPADKTLLTCRSSTKKRGKKRIRTTSCTRKQVTGTTNFKKSRKVKLTSGTLTLKKTKLKVQVELRGARTRLLSATSPKRGNWKLKIGKKTSTVKIR